MSEFNPTAYQLTLSAWEAVDAARRINDQFVAVESMIYDLAYRGADVMELLLKVHERRPLYEALVEHNARLKLPSDTDLFDCVFNDRPAQHIIDAIDAVHAALSSNQMPSEYLPAFSSDRQITLSRLIFIGQRAVFVIERQSHRSALRVPGINVPTRINMTQPLDHIKRDLLSS